MTRRVALSSPVSRDVRWEQSRKARPNDLPMTNFSAKGALRRQPERNKLRGKSPLRVKMALHDAGVDVLFPAPLPGQTKPAGANVVACQCT